VKTPALTIVGERINSSRRSIARAIEQRDEALIQREAQMQREAGADYIDVNAGTFLGAEAEYLPWLVRTVQAVVDAPLSLDSPDPVALQAALKEHRGTPIINSISLERKKIESVLPLAVEHSCGVIALLVDGVRMATRAEEKLGIAVRLVKTLTDAGIRACDIYVDPVIHPVGMEGAASVETLKAFSLIRAELPEVHVLCGLRNISFQMPQRHLLDRAFLAMAMAGGADSAIVDPCDGAIMSTIVAAEALLGRDELGLRYIRACRKGTIGTRDTETVVGGS
jgi:5-methyltetrahydrofolate--homocysteine methyltransferase